MRGEWQAIRQSANYTCVLQLCAYSPKEATVGTSLQPPLTYTHSLTHTLTYITLCPCMLWWYYPLISVLLTQKVYSVNHGHPPGQLHMQHDTQCSQHSLLSVIRPHFKPSSSCLSSTSTCVLPLSLSSLFAFLILFAISSLPSPSTTCWAAAWRAWGAAQRPPAPTAPRTPPRQPCPPPRPTPSPTPPLRACRLHRPSPPTPTTPDHTPSRCPSSNPAPPSLPHGPWVHTLSWLWQAVCASVCASLSFFFLPFWVSVLQCNYLEHTWTCTQRHSLTHTHRHTLAQASTCAGVSLARESNRAFSDSSLLTSYCIWMLMNATEKVWLFFNHSWLLRYIWVHLNQRTVASCTCPASQH